MTKRNIPGQISDTTCPHQVSTTAIFPINVPPKQQACQDALGSPLAVGTENGETQTKHWGRGHVPEKLWCGTWSKATEIQGYFKRQKIISNWKWVIFVDVSTTYHMFKHAIISFLGKTRGWQYSDIPILKEMPFEKEGDQEKNSESLKLISQELQ